MFVCVVEVWCGAERGREGFRSASWFWDYDRCVGGSDWNGRHHLICIQKAIGTGINIYLSR